MLIRPLMSLTLAAMAGFFFTLSAEANPRFKVENTTDSKIDVYIYNGDDTACHTAHSVGKVQGDETKSFGCKGNRKGKCKIKLWSHGDRICTESRNTCSGHAIKMKAKSKAVVSETKDPETNEFETTCDLVMQK